MDISKYLYLFDFVGCRLPKFQAMKSRIYDLMSTSTPMLMHVQLYRAEVHLFQPRQGQETLSVLQTEYLDPNRLFSLTLPPLLSPPLFSPFLYSIGNIHCVFKTMLRLLENMELA